MNNTNTVIDEDDSGKVRYKDLRCGDMFEYGNMVRIATFT